MEENNNTKETWRARLRRLGKEYFELEEMERLGFLDLDLVDIALFKDKLAELSRLRSRLRKLNKDLTSLEDIDTLIKEVRKLRIERVRKERIVKKAERAEKLRKKREAEALRRQNTPSYLGEGVSLGLHYKDTEEDKLGASGFPVIRNVAELGEAMGLTPSDISWLSYHRRVASNDHYHRFYIPKKKGGQRLIASPKRKLRIAQGWILGEILSKVPLNEHAMAFRSGLSIKDNAEKHLQKKVVIRIDLKDFFPSIKFKRIKGLFRHFGYSEGIASILGLICSDAARIEAKLDDKPYHIALSERYLPQGACTSPALTNIICRKLDRRLAGLAQKWGYTYTRYADDIVLSHEEEVKGLGAFLKFVKAIIEEEGFEVNEEKLKVMRPHSRQVVTGIVVNKHLNISRRDYRNFRSFLHHYSEKGAEEMSKKIGKNATQYAKGYFSFMRMVAPHKAERIKEKYPWLENN